MVSIIVPTPVSEHLVQIKERVELRDDRGNVLGDFTPAKLTTKRPSCEPPSLTEEELRQIEDDPREYSTEEVLSDLGIARCSP